MCHGNEFLLLELPLDPMDIAGRSFLELVNDSLPAVHCDPEGSRKRELVSNLGDLLHHGRGPPESYLSGGPRNDHDRRDPALRAQGCDTGPTCQGDPESVFLSSVTAMLLLELLAWRVTGKLLGLQLAG